MKYRVIFTHDPQDYFNGDLSAEETSEQVDFDTSNMTTFHLAYTLNNVLYHVQNGYKAIILPKEGDDSG